VIGSRLATRIRREEAGFTLIEVVVSMAVLGVMFAVYSDLFSTTLHVSGTVINSSVAQSETRAAIDGLASDMRQSYTGDPATSAIAGPLSGTSITFYSPDRATPFHLRKITYQLSGGALQRQFALSTNTNGPPWTFGTMSAWNTLSSSITNATLFTYQDATGATTSTAANVNRVGITVTVSPPASGGATYTYSTSVTRRNQ